MEFELEVLASVIDERIASNVQTKVTNEMRTLAFQLRNLMAFNDINVKIEISQDGICYYEDESAVTVEDTVTSDETIDNLITNENSTTSHQLRPRPLPIVDQKLKDLLDAIQYWFNDEHYQPMLLLESLTTTEALQLQWMSYQQLATGGGPPAYGTLRCHYELGHTIKRHRQQLIQQGTNAKEAEQQCKLFFQSITNETGYRSRYRACTRLIELFQDCPPVLQYLDPHLAVSQLGKMSRSGYAIYQNAIQDKLTTLIIGMVSNL